MNLQLDEELMEAAMKHRRSCGIAQSIARTSEAALWASSKGSKPHRSSKHFTFHASSPRATHRRMTYGSLLEASEKKLTEGRGAFVKGVNKFPI